MMGFNSIGLNRIGMNTILNLAYKLEKVTDEMTDKEDFTFPLNKQEFLCLKIMIEETTFSYSDKSQQEFYEKEKKEKGKKKK